MDDGIARKAGPLPAARKEREVMGECEDGKEYRCWEELLPDALGLIFRNLPLQEVLTVVPRVCKSWGRVVAGSVSPGLPCDPLFSFIGDK